MISCEYELCLYWQDGHCTLDTIAVDYTGRCDECITLSFDRETIVRRRQETLERYRS